MFLVAKFSYSFNSLKNPNEIDVFRMQILANRFRFLKVFFILLQR